MKEIGSIGKSQTNTHQGFKFRGIDQFVNALYPALTKNGVFMTVDVLERTETIKDVVRSNGNPGVDKHVALRVKYTFHAEDGSSVSSILVSEGLDSGDKATNKALSAALKYALIQTFSIPTVDMEEADSTSPVMGTTKAAKKSAIEEKIIAAATTGAVNPPISDKLKESADNIANLAAASNGAAKKSFRKTDAKVEGWEN